VVPEAYLLQMGGMLNAFATRFLGRDFLVLYSDVVDGLADNPDALNFYIGHEIGHIKRKHLTLVDRADAGRAPAAGGRGLCARPRIHLRPPRLGRLRRPEKPNMAWPRWRPAASAGAPEREQLYRAGAADLGLLDVLP
jgi:hypothetical protein